MKTKLKGKTMTNEQRRAFHKRKERNQRLVWFLQDTVGAICLIAMGYGLTLIVYAIQ